MAVRQNIEESNHLFMGEDRILVFLITEDGQPLNCSGMDLEWALARHPSDEPVVQVTTPEITVDDGDGTGDEISVPLDATDTQSLLPGWYSHTLRRTDQGSVIVLSYGKVYLGETP